MPKPFQTREEISDGLFLQTTSPNWTAVSHTSQRLKLKLMSTKRDGDTKLARENNSATSQSFGMLMHSARVESLKTVKPSTLPKLQLQRTVTGQVITSK